MFAYLPRKTLHIYLEKRCIFTLGCFCISTYTAKMCIYLHWKHFAYLVWISCAYLNWEYFAHSLMDVFALLCLKLHSLINTGSVFCSDRYSEPSLSIYPEFPCVSSLVSLLFHLVFTEQQPGKRCQFVQAAAPSF